MMLSFSQLWDNHPYPESPCDSSFVNQCAIRMGVALEKSGVNLSIYHGAKCYPGFGHNPKHVLRAQELATWLLGRHDLVGKAVKKKSVTQSDYAGKKGIVFIQDGWGSTDHIDVWDGSKMLMKGGSPDYFALGKEVWFWELL
ncbi:type VI secretion system amidase effector protein Tae4 [Kosakonia oryzendophytica]|nr:type VI secretion system amidase effector protein Tae4 [Kosakonia oryzendophytica]WBT56759.1 type VI secretion system amidase effector protein Tae4 [Kosakonia oryzendophytica]